MAGISLETKCLVCENFVFHRFLGHYFEIVFLFLSIYDTYILRVLRNILESLLRILSHTHRQRQLCLDFLFIEGGIKKSARILSSFNVLTSCSLSFLLLQSHSMLYVCMYENHMRSYDDLSFFLIGFVFQFSNIYYRSIF